MSFATNHPVSREQAKVMNRFDITKRLVSRLHHDEAVIGGIGYTNFDLWAAGRRPTNLAVVIMDNGTYQITGGQITSTELGADIVAIARGAGIDQSAWAADEGAFEELIDLALREDGPWLIGCRIDKEKPAETTERDPPRIRDQFMRGLGVKK